MKRSARTAGPRVPVRFLDGPLHGVTAQIRCDGQWGPPYELMPGHGGSYAYDGCDPGPEHVEVWLWTTTT